MGTWNNQEGMVTKAKKPYKVRLEEEEGWMAVINNHKIMEYFIL